MLKVILLGAILAHFTTIITGQVEGISSKLDFGNSDSSTNNYDSTLSTSLVKALVSLRQSTGPDKTIISSKLDQSPFNLKSIAPLAQKADGKHDFASLGIVCVDGSCNKTESKTGEKLSTDILVQVVTNVDNKNKTSDTNLVVGANDDNDVPVVVGYGGTNLKNSGLDSASRRVDGVQDVTIETNPSKTDPNYNFYQVHKENGHRGINNEFHEQVPYFDPAFNNHYFGENPPPQFVWHRRRPGYSNNNPHMFNVNSRNYKPLFQWQLKFPTISQQHTPTGWTPTTTCSCSNPGLNWYPSFGPQQPTPSSTVNDKMAPLN